MHAVGPLTSCRSHRISHASPQTPPLHHDNVTQNPTRAPSRRECYLNSIRNHLFTRIMRPTRCELKQRRRIWRWRWRALSDQTPNRRPVIRRELSTRCRDCPPMPAAIAHTSCLCSISNMLCAHKPRDCPWQLLAEGGSSAELAARQSASPSAARQTPHGSRAEARAEACEHGRRLGRQGTAIDAPVKLLTSSCRFDFAAVLRPSAPVLTHVGIRYHIEPACWLLRNAFGVHRLV